MDGWMCSTSYGIATVRYEGRATSRFAALAPAFCLPFFFYSLPRKRTITVISRWNITRRIFYPLFGLGPAETADRVRVRAGFITVSTGALLCKLPYGGAYIPPSPPDTSETDSCQGTHELAESVLLVLPSASCATFLFEDPVSLHVSSHPE
jgi:hypothetical protein